MATKVTRLPATARPSAASWTRARAGAGVSPLAIPGHTPASPGTCRSAYNGAKVVPIIRSFRSPFSAWTTTSALVVGLLASACTGLVGSGRGHFTGASPPPEAPAAAPPSPPPPPPEPTGWILEVHGVRVATLRTGSTDHWDGAVAEAAASKSGLCGVIGVLIGGAAGAVVGGPGLAPGGAVIGKGVSEAFCPEAHPVARERDPQAPDLVVALSAGEQSAEHVLRTPTARDSYEESFDYAFVVPTAVIPAQGVQIRVQDQDGPGDFETLGVFRLSLLDLHQAESQPLVVLTDGAVVRLELSVTRAPEPSTEVVQLELTGGLQVVSGDPIPAGEWVEIRTRGSYSLAKDRAPVGPAGGGKWKDGNIKEAPFATAEHGAALAVLGFGQRIEKLLVPDCVGVSTRYAGPLLVGVNDTSAADNSGQLEFTISRRVPTAAEWLHIGEPSGCSAL